MRERLKTPRGISMRVNCELSRFPRSQGHNNAIGLKSRGINKRDGQVKWCELTWLAGPLVPLMRRRASQPLKRYLEACGKILSNFFHEYSVNFLTTWSVIAHRRSFKKPSWPLATHYIAKIRNKSRILKEVSGSRAQVPVATSRSIRSLSTRHSFPDINQRHIR